MTTPRRARGLGAVRAAGPRPRAAPGGRCRPPRPPPPLPPLLADGGGRAAPEPPPLRVDARDPRHTGRPRDAREPLALLRPERHPGADFYVGRVAHSRKYPVRRRFAYPAVSADRPRRAPALVPALGPGGRPPRRGRVPREVRREWPRSLTSPWTFGYAQNPISVYYCFDEPPEAAAPDRSPSKSDPGSPRVGRRRSLLRCCVAEVTNTPWGERVRFDFDPRGQRVPKSLHVSPFMDAEGDWDIRTTLDADAGAISLHVDVVDHPVFGDYFAASLVAERVGRERAATRQERTRGAPDPSSTASPRTGSRSGSTTRRRRCCSRGAVLPAAGLARGWEKATRREEASDEKAGEGRPPGGGGGAARSLRSTWREARAWPWKRSSPTPRRANGVSDCVCVCVSNAKAHVTQATGHPGSTSRSDQSWVTYHGR